MHSLQKLNDALRRYLSHNNNNQYCSYGDGISVQYTVLCNTVSIFFPPVLTSDMKWVPIGDQEKRVSNSNVPLIMS